MHFVIARSRLHSSLEVLLPLVLCLTTLPILSLPFPASLFLHVDYGPERHDLDDIGIVEDGMAPLLIESYSV